MPPNEQYDLQIGTPGRGFMLARGKLRGRAWRRSGVKSVPGQGSPGEYRFGTTEANLEFKEVFDDFSGGDGHAYRGVAPPNGIHWSDNMDTRWPGMAVHVQKLNVARSHTEPDPYGVVRITDVPSPSGIDVEGNGQVLALTSDMGGAPTPRDVHTFKPTGVAAEGSPFVSGKIDNRPYIGRTAAFGSYHYMGVATGMFVQWRRDISVAVVASLPGTGFVNAGPKLWRYHGPKGAAHFVQSVAAEADPMIIANWSATLSVGDGISPITDMIALDAQVFAGVANGLYASDQSGTFFNVTGPLTGLANQENCRDLDVHEGEVVFQHVAGVFAYAPTVTSRSKLRQISPLPQSSRSPVLGTHRCIRSNGGWLYAGIWTGSQSYLRAGREMVPGDWRWHTLHRLPAISKINRIHFDGITTAYGGTLPIPTRMWIATDASINTGGTAPLYWCPVPRLNGNPLAPDPVFSANYVGSARMDLPAVDRGAPGVKKIGEQVQVWAEGFLSGSRYADVYYTLDRGARTLLGRAQTSPVTTLLMGSTNGSFPVFRSIELSLESFNTTPGTCQVYRAVVLHGNLRPEYVETIEAVITAADETPDRRGTPMRPGSVVLDDLRELADPLRLGSQPHRLIDLAGATSYVVFDGMPEETEAYQEGSENAEIVASIRLVVLTLSQNTQ